MRQLKSNDGIFGSVWSPKVRVVYDFNPGSIFETNPALISDSVGNLFVMYGERNLVDSLFVVKYPFPSTIRYLLSTYQSKYFTASSGNNMLFSWSDGAGLSTISNYNVTLDTQPNTGVVLSGSPFRLYNKAQPFGSGLFPNGEGIAVILGSLDIVYAKYDPSIGSWVEQFLEVKGAIRSFKFYQGVRNNITVAWADDSKLYVKRFKQGKNFGWQPTQSINVVDARRINITDGLDGRVMIVWESFLDDSRNQPRKSDLFAIRLDSVSN